MGVQRQVVRLEGTAATAVIMFVLVAAVVLLFHFLLRFLVAVIFVTFLFLGASLMFGCVLFVVATATGSVVIVVVTVVTLLCVCFFLVFILSGFLAESLTKVWHRCCSVQRMLKESHYTLAQNPMRFF